MAPVISVPVAHMAKVNKLSVGQALAEFDDAGGLRSVGRSYAITRAWSGRDPDKPRMIEDRIVESWREHYGLVDAPRHHQVLIPRVGVGADYLAGLMRLNTPEELTTRYRASNLKTKALMDRAFARNMRLWNHVHAHRVRGPHGVGGISPDVVTFSPYIPGIIGYGDEGVRKRYAMIVDKQLLDLCSAVRLLGLSIRMGCVGDQMYGYGTITVVIWDHTRIHVPHRNPAMLTDTWGW